LKRSTPYPLTRKQQKRQAAASLDTDGPLTCVEGQIATVHCDACEMAEGLHDVWRSANGYPVRVICAPCREKGER
jgi:hypothetical protein